MLCAIERFGAVRACVCVERERTGGRRQSCACIGTSWPRPTDFDDSDDFANTVNGGDDSGVMMVLMVVMVVIVIPLVMMTPMTDDDDGVLRVY